MRFRLHYYAIVFKREKGDLGSRLHNHAPCRITGAGSIPRTDPPAVRRRKAYRPGFGALRPARTRFPWLTCPRIASHASLALAHRLLKDRLHSSGRTAARYGARCQARSWHVGGTGASWHHRRASLKIRFASTEAFPVLVGGAWKAPSSAHGSLPTPKVRSICLRWFLRPRISPGVFGMVRFCNPS